MRENKFDSAHKNSKFLLEIMTLVLSANNIVSGTEFITSTKLVFGLVNNRSYVIQLAHKTVLLCYLCGTKHSGHLHRGSCFCCLWLCCVVLVGKWLNILSR